MRLSEYIDNYVRDHDVKPVTAQDYRWVVGTFERWATRSVELSDLDAALISDYLQWLGACGRSAATVHTRRTKLLLLWRAAWMDGYTENRPDERIRRVRVPPPNPDAWNADAVRALVAYCQQSMRHPLRTVPVPAGDYLAALFAFLWDTGMRLGDALSMEWKWISPTITWRQSKTSRWHRAKLSQSTLASLELIRTPQRALVWPRPAKSRTALYRMIRRAADGAGLKGTSKYIRRGVATDVYLSGGDPGQALGHVPGSRVAFRHYVSQEAQLSPVSPTEL